jgi:hypothetical protein
MPHMAYGPMGEAAPATRRLCAQGQPVIPISAAVSETWVRQVAAHFGVGVSRAEDMDLLPAETQRPARPLSLVLALGAEAWEAAALYAHLTRRPLGGVWDGGSLPPTTACVVGLWRSFSQRLVAQVLATGSATGMGLVLGRTPGELLRQVVAKALALHGSPLRPPESRAHLGMAPFSTTVVGGQRVTGQQASPEEIHASFSQTGLLSILAHGDGLDAGLGRGAVLCGHPPGPPLAQGERGPRCRRTETCYRRREAVSSLRQRGVLRTFEEVHSQVCLLLTCRGVRVLEGAADPEFGLAAQAHGNPRIGAFATTWRICSTDFGAWLALHDALVAGQPLGSALTRYNAQAQHSGGELLLFGDPDLAFSSETELPLDPPAALAPAPRPSPRQTVLPSAPLPSPAAAGERAVDGKGQGRESSHHDLLLALLAQAASRTDERPWARQAAEAAVARPTLPLLARWMAQRAHIFDLWEARMPCQYESAGPCLRCATPSVQIRSAGSPSRLAVTCAVCGVVADVPAPASAPVSWGQITVQQGVVRVVGTWRPPRESAGELSLHRRFPDVPQSVPWPRVEDGWVPAFRLPWSLPLDEPLEIVASFVWAEGFANLALELGLAAPEAPGA